MPVADAWIVNPRADVQHLFARAVQENRLGAGGDFGVAQYAASRLGSDEAWAAVPSLSGGPLHMLRDGQLARFRCMVQDSLGPAFYLGIVEAVDDQGNRTLHTSKYQDGLSLPPTAAIDYNSKRNVTFDCHTFYCIPIPGETEWVRRMDSYEHEAAPVAAAAVGSKRPAADLGPESTADDVAGGGMELDSDAPSKRPRDAREARQLRGEPSRDANDPFDLNYPVPDSRKIACLAVVYENADAIKLNDMIELVGIYSLDSDGAQWQGDEGDDGGFAAAATARAPSSLVPRLHVLAMRKLAHSNPALPCGPHSPAFDVVQREVCSSAAEARANLVALFASRLGDDTLAAEYLLAHLLSSVHARHGDVPVGQLSLNLCALAGGEAGAAVIRDLHDALSILLPKCHYVPLSLEELERRRFCPTKDYSQERLISGELQLSSGTELLVDETVLQPGQLGAQATRNVAALHGVLTAQRVSYDFQYYTTEFDVDINVLVLSEGRSLLPCDVVVPIAPRAAATPMAAADALRAAPAPLLAQLRAYIGAMRACPVAIGPDVARVIEEDFAASRALDRDSFTPQSFSATLTLARLLGLSVGSAELRMEHWEHAKLLERERASRLPRAAPSHGAPRAESVRVVQTTAGSA